MRRTWKGRGAQIGHKRRYHIWALILHRRWGHQKEGYPNQDFLPKHQRAFPARSQNLSIVSRNTWEIGIYKEEDGQLLEIHLFAQFRGHCCFLPWPHFISLNSHLPVTSSINLPFIRKSSQKCIMTLNTQQNAINTLENKEEYLDHLE